MSDNPFSDLQAAFDLQRMESESVKHELADYIFNGDEETIKLLRLVVYTVRQSPEYGSYVEGLCTAALHIKHNQCAACGINHDTALLPPVDDGTKQLTIDDELEENDPDKPDTFLADLKAQLANDPDLGAPGPDSYVNRMEEYNLREPRDGEVEAEPEEEPVICKGCNMLYQSLHDRMLRPVGIDGCHGCQIKSAHG